MLIESRIVEASSNFNKALGVQWGGNASFTQATGNPTGLVFPNNVAAAGGAGARQQLRHRREPELRRVAPRRRSATARAARSASCSARRAARST